MEIKLIKEKLNILLNDLARVKKEAKFDQLLIDYKKVKKELWKANKELKDSEDKDKINELHQEIKILESKKKECISKFKDVEKKEKSVYLLKNTVDREIKALDTKKNYNDVKLSKLTSETNEIISITDKKQIDEHNNLIKELEKNKEKLTEEIEIKVTKKEIAVHEKEELRVLNRKERDLNNISRKIENADKETLLAKKKENESLIKELQKQSDEYQKDIDKLLEMINTILDALSFIDAEDVNLKSSFSVKHLNVWYGSKKALFDINIDMPKNKVIAIIGPSGCGKSTFLRTLNRINDNIPSFKAKGKILLDGEYDIFKLRSIRNRYDKMELSTLRTKVGMIFQQPNPFPMSIAKNVQYGPKVKGIKNKSVLNELTEQSLKDAGLWEEVKDNLKALGTSLSGGQQQRLCIARAIANEPEILLMDEPTSALDPIAAKIIEDLILKLKKHYTIIMVTHSMQQAQRISDHTAFFYQGELIEYGTTKQIFESPKQQETKDYISGKFG